MTMEDETGHSCVREESWWEYDGRGIPLVRVCSDCQERKLKTFRPEILEFYTEDDVDERIEPDE